MKSNICAVVPDECFPLQITSRPLVSKHGPPVTGTLRADEISAQSPSTPPFLAHILPLLRRPPPTPAWGPSVLPGSENGVSLQQANNDKEQENIASPSPKLFLVPQSSPFYTAIFRFSSAINVDSICRSHGNSTPSTCDDGNRGYGDATGRA